MQHAVFYWRAINNCVLYRYSILYYIRWLYGLSYIRRFTHRHGYSADTGRRIATRHGPKDRSKSNFAQVWIAYTRGKLCMYIKWYKVEIENPTHRNVTGSSMTATLSVLSPSSILSPNACHYAFTPRGNFRRVGKKCYYFKCIYFLISCVKLIFRIFKLLQSRRVCSDNVLCLLYNVCINW